VAGAPRTSTVIFLDRSPVAGAAWRRRVSRAASGSTLSLTTRCFLIRLPSSQKPGWFGETCRARCRFETGDQRRKPAFRSTVASYLSRAAWSPSPEHFVFTGTGPQSIAAALAAVIPTGGRCGVEALTYPSSKASPPGWCRWRWTKAACSQTQCNSRTGRPFLGHLYSTSDPKSVGHDDDLNAPSRSRSHCRKTQPSDLGGQCLRLPR
jgi:hypothetical protein